MVKKGIVCGCQETLRRLEDPHPLDAGDQTLRSGHPRGSRSDLHKQERRPLRPAIHELGNKQNKKQAT